MNFRIATVMVSLRRPHANGYFTYPGSYPGSVREFRNPFQNFPTLCSVPSKSSAPPCTTSTSAPVPTTASSRSPAPSPGERALPSTWADARPRHRLNHSTQPYFRSHPHSPRSAGLQSGFWVGFIVSKRCGHSGALAQRRLRPQSRPACGKCSGGCRNRSMGAGAFLPPSGTGMSPLR